MLWHSNCNFTKRAEWPPCTCPLKEINKNGTKIALLYEYLMSILTQRGANHCIISDGKMIWKAGGVGVILPK